MTRRDKRSDSDCPIQLQESPVLLWDSFDTDWSTVIATLLLPTSCKPGRQSAAYPYRACGFSEKISTLGR
jgi:hypothetical protein